MNRRDFIKNIAVAAPMVMLISKVADAQVAGDEESQFDITIEANHGHVLVIPLVDLQKLETLTYEIKGRSSHNHTVVVEKDLIQKLLTGQPIEVESSVAGGHAHLITIDLARVALRSE